MTVSDHGVDLTFEHVTLHMGGLAVLDEVTIEVGAASMHGVIGPNGAGKSSLLNCVSGFYRPQGGRIRVGDAEVTGCRPDVVARCGVARVFQNVELFDGSDVRTNVLLGRHLSIRSGAIRDLVGWPGVRQEERRHRRRVDEILDLVGLGEHADENVSRLPYGKQKLVEIARALAMEPRVLLLDEPVAGMGTGEKAAVVAAIGAAQRTLGMTVVLVEHDVELVMRLVDQVTVLVSGTVLTTGSPREVRDDPRVIEAYIGVDEDVVRSSSTPGRQP